MEVKEGSATSIEDPAPSLDERRDVAQPMQERLEFIETGGRRIANRTLGLIGQ